jgi:hypothetical protein
MGTNFSLIGFEFLNGSYKEYLPKIDQAQSVQKQRAVFFSMYNFYVSSSLQLQKHEIDTKKTLYENFSKKILSLLPLKGLKVYKKPTTFKVDITTSVLVNNFLSKNPNEQKRVLATKPKLLIGKFIQLIDTTSSLLFDVNDIFSNLVYKRIKSVNKDKTVHFMHDGVLIKQENQSTFVLINFDNFDKKTLGEQIKLIQQKIQQESHQLIYVIYPKSDDFQKHIELKLPQMGLSEEEYRVKLVPYSFSFCLKNFKGEKQCK